jgi:hypothetical protein
VQRRATGRLGLAAKRRAEKRGGDESSPHSLPESPGEWQWRLAGRARVASGDGGWRSARGDRSPLFQSQLGSSSAEWSWVFFFFFDRMKLIGLEAHYGWTLFILTINSYLLVNRNWLNFFDAFLPQSQKIMHSLHQLVGSFWGWLLSVRELGDLCQGVCSCANVEKYYYLYFGQLRWTSILVFLFYVNHKYVSFYLCES